MKQLETVWQLFCIDRKDICTSKTGLLNTRQFTDRTKLIDTREQQLETQRKKVEELERVAALSQRSDILESDGRATRKKLLRIRDELEVKERSIIK